MFKKKKLVYSILTVIFAVVLVAFGRTTYVLYQEKVKTENQGGFSVSEASVSGETVLWNGKEYERDPSIKAFLFIGVDTSGELEEKVTTAAGQADGVFLVAYDTARSKVKILMIPRDTMTPITLTDLSGNVLGKDRQHLLLAFTYGDGREQSCVQTVEAVSELLGGLSIDGYLAMNTGSIADLNNLVGGVKVRVETDGMERRDPALVKGAELTLSGKQAEIFVRYRDINIDFSAISRLSQQRQYMEAYFRTIHERVKKDDQVIVKLMDMIQSQMLTNLSKDQYLNIGKSILYSEVPFGSEDMMTIPGESYDTELYDEYHHDPDGTQQMVLDLFYREK